MAAAQETTKRQQQPLPMNYRISNYIPDESSTVGEVLSKIYKKKESHERYFI